MKVVGKLTGECKLGKWEDLCKFITYENITYMKDSIVITGLHPAL